mgnify:CR=1 FL=1
MIWLPRKEKLLFFREAANRLLSFEDELERNNYIEAVASAYKVSKESLEKLVAKTAVSTGLARPVTRPKKADGAVLQKEDGIVTSQKVLLTWMIEDESLFGMIRKYIMPEDFTTELYRTVALLLYEQYEKGEVNPAKDYEPLHR